MKVSMMSSTLREVDSGGSECNTTAKDLANTTILQLLPEIQFHPSKSLLYMLCLD